MEPIGSVGDTEGMTRRREVSLLVALLVPAVLAPALLAQGTHRVGPSGYAQIREALAVAAPGDTILVEPGTYAHFEVQRPVVLRAETPGTVFVQYDPVYAAPGCLADPVCAASEGATRFMLLLGEVAHVRGIQFLPSTTVTASGVVVRHRVEAIGGRVTFDDCTIEARGAVAFAVIDSIAHLQDVDVRSYGDATVASGCTVLRGVITAVGGAIVGGDAIAGQIAAPGLELDTAWCYASFVEVRGGSHSARGYPAPALRITNVYQVQFADSRLVAGTSAGHSVCAVIGNGNLRAARTPFVTSATGCNAYVPFQVLGTARSQPLALGQRFAVGAQHDRGMPVAFYASPALATVQMAGIEQPLFVDPSRAVQIGFAFTDGSFSCGVEGTVPNDPSLRGLEFWVVAVSPFGSSFPLPWLMVTSPVGGVL